LLQIAKHSTITGDDWHWVMTIAWSISMSAHSKLVVERFCELCDWLLQIWQTRKLLFDENPDIAALKAPRHAHFFYRLQEVLQDCWLHELIKLHDPAVQGGGKGCINLSIPYMIEYGHWDAATKRKLDKLYREMNDLAESIKPARNKILSHNDLAVLLDSTELGAFDQGADEDYFGRLTELAALISMEVLGTPFVFDVDLVHNDVAGFMRTKRLGTILRHTHGVNHDP
jgi:hypothetical protein